MLRTLIIIGGLVLAVSQAAMAAAEFPMSSAPQTEVGQPTTPDRNTEWRATERIVGLTGQGQVLEPGETVFLSAPPPSALVDQGKLVEVRLSADGVPLEIDNLRALLVESRRDRDRYRAERDQARADIERLERQIERDGERIGILTADLEAARDGRAAADAELAAAQAELALRPPLPDRAELLDDVPGATIRAEVNRRRAELDLEPFGGDGAEARARKWASARRDVIESILARRA